MALDATDVIRMEARVDDGLHRLVGDLAELAGDLARRLNLGPGSDDDHAVVAHHHDGVADRPADGHIDVVADLMDLPLEDRTVGHEIGIDPRCHGEWRCRSRGSGSCRCRRQPPTLAPAAQGKEGTCHTGSAIVEEPASVHHRSILPSPWSVWPAAAA